MKKIFILLIAVLFFNTQVFSATKIKYPDSSDVEPKVNLNDEENSATIKGGVECVIDVNLDDCIRLALGNNPRIQSAMQDVFASDARIKQVWSNYFPQFSWQSGYSRIRQLQLSDVFRENLIYNYWVLGQISGSQLLYDFGVTQNQVSIKKLDSLSYRIILTGTINDVIFNVKDAYYNLQYAIEAKKVALKTLNQYIEFYEQAKAYYNAGVKPKVDVTISEVNLSNAKLSLIQAEHSEKIAMARLNNVIGIPYFVKYSIPDRLKFNSSDLKLEDAISISEKSRPEFQLAEVKVEQANQNLKLIRKVWFPRFYIQGQFEVGGRHPDSNYGYSWGGYINFPTINGMLIKNELKEAKALFSKEQSNALNTKNQVYFEVQNAFYTLNEKKCKIPVAKVGMKQAKDNYELSLNRYNVGVADAVELNSAQVQYVNSQLTYYKTMYEYNSARANMERVIGRNLTEDEISLELNNKNG